MKKYSIFLFLITCFLMANNTFAQSNCTTNDHGDVTCQDPKNPNVTYTTPSVSTLTSKAHIQGITDQQTALEQQQQTLNKQALQEVITNQIASDPKLSTQQAAITKSLNALQSQTK